jgi:hypothetical protein
MSGNTPIVNFDIRKNITETFDLIVPGYEEADTPVARMRNSFSIVLENPSLAVTLPASGVEMAISSPQMASVSTVITVGDTIEEDEVYTSDGYYDCYIYWKTVGLVKTGEEIVLGNINSRICKDWFPFQVSVPQGTNIVSAKIAFVCSTKSTGTTLASLRFGCEASDDAQCPTSYDELNMKNMTIAVADFEDIEPYVKGEAYEYDITEPVQEVINRTNWLPTNILAVMCIDNGSPHTINRRAASSRHATYDPPTLTITY